MTHDESSMEKSLTKNFKTKKISQLSQKISKYIKIIIKNLHISKKKLYFCAVNGIVRKHLLFSFATKAAMSIEEWIRNREQHGQVTFSVAEVREAFPTHSPKGLKTELSRTVKRGRIIAVYRGFYVIVPVQYQLKHIVPPQFYLDALMQHIGKPYYVCLLSAATLYAAAHQRPMQYQVMTVIPRISMSNKYPLISWNYRTEIPEHLLVTRNAEMGILRYASPELTAIDLVQFADHVGGYQRAATVLAELMESVEMQKMADAIPYTTTATVQRLGYLLEFVLEEQDKSDKLFALLKAQAPKYHTICMSNSRPPREDAPSNRWHVNMNIDIEIDEFLGNTQHLLRNGATFDPQTAYELVREKLIDRLAPSSALTDR